VTNEKVREHLLDKGYNSKGIQKHIRDNFTPTRFSRLEPENENEILVSFDNNSLGLSIKTITKGISSRLFSPFSKRKFIESLKERKFQAQIKELKNSIDPLQPFENYSCNLFLIRYQGILQSQDKLIY
jgi:hypothetical protein